LHEGNALALLQILWVLPALSLFQYAPQAKVVQHRLWVRFPIPLHLSPTGTNSVLAIVFIL